MSQGLCRATDADGTELGLLFGPGPHLHQLDENDHCPCVGTSLALVCSLII